MVKEVGFVKSVKNSLLYLDGLPTIKINDLVENESGMRGWVNSLLPDAVEVLILDEGNIQPGQLFKRTGTKLTVPVGDFLLGRAVNPMGIPIDGHGYLAKSNVTKYAELDQIAPGIAARKFINEQFETGITLIDALIPIGKGQRELILGDPRSGKTDTLIDIILNQKNTKVVCIYASIGKPITEVRTVIDTLRVNHSLPYTVVVAASSSDPAPLIYLTPRTAFTIAEYFQRQGKDVLVILDDLGNHAKIYREIALLGDRSAGRESYPGDMFYQHGHLLERAGNFKPKAGGGSITALPAIELNLNDFTTLIPTNIMSMTDGHILFKSALYNQGQRPAIDLSLSVSRVGHQTQSKAQSKLATQVKQILAQAAQLETVSRFSFELPASTQLTLRQKELIEEIIHQPILTCIPKNIQVILLALPFTKFLQTKNSQFIRDKKEALINAFTQDPQLSQIAQQVPNFASLDDLIMVLNQMENKLEQITGGKQ